MRGSSWFEDQTGRRRFEAAALRRWPRMRREVVGTRGAVRVRYSLVVPVPYYESRRVEWHFAYNQTRPRQVWVLADGPEESPHRWGPEAWDPLRRRPLCIWDPKDPPRLRWTPSDGLRQLVIDTRAHLFREAYWRETGEWVGLEAPHGPLDEEEIRWAA